MLPQIVLVRHGETPWSTEGRHTGHSDLPLTEAGAEEALGLPARLGSFVPDQVFTSPLLRARDTARLAGFPQAEEDPDLMEWHYGTLEGLTLAEIHQQMPGWSVFQNGSPRGESVDQVIERAGRVVARLRELEGRTLLFLHGHISRVIAARWCGLPLEICPHLMLNTAAVSVLGYDRRRTMPAILSWNIRGALVLSPQVEVNVDEEG